MIDGLVLAFQFFTRLPINRIVEFNEQNIRKSIFFFPLVGGLIGLIAGLIYYPISTINRDMASLLALICLIFLTGGLHIDGLSDTFDGFLSNKEKDRILEIMKDSHIGAYGALSMLVLLLAKFIIISSFDKGLVLALILSLANSRFVVSRIISYKKNARLGGLGDMFHNSRPGNAIIIIGLIYIVVISFINILYIIPLLVNFLVGELFSIWSYKKIGGMTGDTYGAIIEIGDTISLLSFWGVMIWIY
ncbi:adenosylcobinamide-GDP ribazoletransferase [Tissierella creatinini]|nr:adenosylcobinamide-GDP ribazoletransferase [Tissierella creatinini]TJX65595.1 adenosylcobinamide-GDP ribazoletransferase [Soehngenia saccharolytica]